MNSFASYIDELGKYTCEVLASPEAFSGNSQIQNSLFCAQQVERHLRKLIPIEKLRNAGSFFTGNDIANDAVRFFGNTISQEALIFDPACGAGNLLIAASKKLSVIKSSLRRTLKAWGNCLAGLDIFEEFVEATKTRLILEAVSRGANPDILDVGEAKSFFPHITVGNALDGGEIFRKATHLIFNPPYYKMSASPSCNWGDGSINSAARFVEAIVSNSREDTFFCMILPDVLRAGTRYKRWRAFINSIVEGSVTSSGRFDSRTDVDVFFLTGRVSGKGTTIDWLGDQYSGTVVGDLFKIAVGPVVPYRDAQSGAPAPFIFPKNLPPWAVVCDKELVEKWNFSGTLFRPPFVAIRRTSSPSDLFRATGTLVKGGKGIAVENHLVVAIPKTGTIADCRKLIQILRNHNTNKYLNKRIRCRHLTVSAIREIPWVGDFNGK